MVIILGVRAKSQTINLQYFEVRLAQFVHHGLTEMYHPHKYNFNGKEET